MLAVSRKAAKLVDAPAAPALIVQSLREAIILGTIKPGVPLRQDHIAAEFGVSHIPVARLCENSSLTDWPFSSRTAASSSRNCPPMSLGS